MLWKVRVLLVILYCLSVEVDCGCSWKALRRVLSWVSLVVLEGVAYRVWPVSPIGL